LYRALQCVLQIPRESATQRLGISGQPHRATSLFPVTGSATLVQKLRRSVAVATPIEQVIDPHLHHLNVAVALGESVAGEESGDPSRNNKCPIIQPKIIILDLRRPTRC